MCGLNISMSNHIRPFIVLNEKISAVPHRSVSIELADSDRGFLPNRLTTEQRDAIIDPLPGLLIFNLSALSYEFFDGASWQKTGGSVALSSGVITTPVEFFDIPLPDGFQSFSLRINGFFFSAIDYLAGAFSSDGGVSFDNDTLNQDTYFQNFFVVDSLGLVGPQSMPTGLLSLSTQQFTSDLTTLAGSVDIEIYPGSSTTIATCYNIRGFNSQSRTNPQQSFFGGSYYNQDATNSIVAARVDLLRILPFGNGDCDEPTSGTTLNNGYWSLSGVPNSV